MEGVSKHEPRRETARAHEPSAPTRHACATPTPRAPLSVPNFHTATASHTSRTPGVGTSRGDIEATASLAPFSSSPSLRVLLLPLACALRCLPGSRWCPSSRQCARPMLPVVLVASEAAKPHAGRPEEHFDFIGCFADDFGAHDIDGWELAEARGKMDTRRCAETCATSTYFALQDGKCQCAAKFGLSPKFSKIEAEACGPVCPGEEGLSPPRRCGLAGRNAVWAHSSCLLGAAFELENALSPDKGMQQFKAGIRFDRWQPGVRLVLDWGALPVTARRAPPCAHP